MESQKKYIGGIVGGISGGVVFGMMMAMMGMMPMIAKMIGSDSAAVGWIIHLIISATIGITYVWLFGNKTLSAMNGIVYGMIHGVIWWVLGALTIMPLMLGMGVQYGNAFAKMNMMSLMGHIIYGVILGLVFYVMVNKKTQRENH